MEIKSTKPQPTGIEAKRENHVKVVLEVPERVLEHKYASFSLRVLHDGEGGQKQIDEIFYFRHEDLQSISTIRREAVEEVVTKLESTLPDCSGCTYDKDEGTHQSMSKQHFRRFYLLGVKQ